VWNSSACVTRNSWTAPASLSIGYVNQDLVTPGCAGMHIYVGYTLPNGQTNADLCYAYTENGGTSWTGPKCDIADNSALARKRPTPSSVIASPARSELQRTELLWLAALFVHSVTPLFTSSGYRKDTAASFWQQGLDSENSYVGSGLPEQANFAMLNTSDGVYVLYTTIFDAFGLISAR